MDKAKRKNSCDFWLAIFDVWSLGIVFVVSGDYVGWNIGVPVGYTPLITATVLVGIAYVALMLCIGEILSGLPFSGGAYGLVRITIGFYAGFLIAITEACYLIAIVSLNVTSLAWMACTLFNLSSTYSPLLWFLYFLIANVFLIFRTSVTSFCRVNNIFAVCSVAIVIISCFGPANNLSNVPTVPVTDQVPNHPLSVFKCFSQVVWLFVGIENLAYSCGIVSCPREVVAKGSIACAFTLLLTGMLVVSFASYRQAPGVLAAEPFPLNPSFMSLFNCSYLQATALSLPATFAGFYSFIFCYGTLLDALSESGLLPEQLSRKFNGVPWVAFVVGSVISYCTCLVVFYRPEIYHILLTYCALAAFISYCAYTIGYIRLKLQFSEIHFKFSSPIGIFGALYAFIVFFCAVVSLIFFLNGGFIALAFLVILSACSSAYYFRFAKRKEKLSPDEKNSLLIAHVIKLKNRRAKQVRTEVSLGSSHTVHKVRLLDTQSGISAKNSTKVHVILQDKKGAEELRAAAQKAFCVENVDFCNAVLSYKIAAEKKQWRFQLKLSTVPSTFLHNELLKIIDNFVADGSPSEVNISSGYKNDILQYKNFELFSSLDAHQRSSIFDKASTEIAKILFDNLL